MANTDKRATAGSLTVVAYHYVRDLPRTRFPRIKGLTIDRFRDQVAGLCERYDMATLDTALAFLDGRRQTDAELCLLTFDDGLKEHYTDVLPILLQHRIQGVFFPATACLEGSVPTVHKIHFLMAALEFSDYRQAFLARLADLSPDTPVAPLASDVERAYPWDPPEVGALKYLANFSLAPALRDRVIADLFAAYLGDEGAFASDLYLTWAQLRELQAHGMIAGGHSHGHSALSGMPARDQHDDLARSFTLLRERLLPQDVWPFAYPYGRFDGSTIEVLRRLGFSCAFTVESGVNPAHHDLFHLRRFDTNEIHASAASPQAAV